MESALVVWIVLSLAIPFALAFIPANIAKSKGRSFGLWWFYGWMLFIVALIHALLLQPDEGLDEHRKLAAGGRRCPFCAEVVKREAVVCRFCGREIEPELQEAGASPSSGQGTDALSEALEASGVSYEELELYMARIGYESADVSSDADPWELALAELQVMSPEKRRRVLGLPPLPLPVEEEMSESGAEEPADSFSEEQDPYLTWNETRSRKHWEEFMAYLFGSVNTMPRGSGAGGVIASAYPEAIGQPDFDAFCDALDRG